jgi:hypothetical protein
MNDAPKLDNAARKALAEESKELLESKAFTAAILALRKQWFGQLMEAQAPETIMAYKYKLEALEAVPQQLAIFVNDQKMADKRMK